MSAIAFELDLVLDGDSYVAARGNQGERQTAVQYVPKVRAASQLANGDPTLDPLDYTTFHRGSGASRSVLVTGMVGYSENAWTIDPGLLMPGPEVSAVTLPNANVTPRPDSVAEADGHIFVVAGRYVFRLTNGQAISPTPSIDLDLGVGHVGYSIKRFGTSLFMSTDGNLYERPDGGAWTNVALGGTAVQPTGALGTVWWTTGTGGTALTSERLVAQFGPRGLRYCAASPRLDTNWTPGLASPAIDMGAPITRLVSSQTHAYVATDRGLHDLDSSGLAPNLTPEAEFGVLPTGGLAAIIKGGIGYISAGYELFRVILAGQSYALVEVITPMSLLPNETPAGGYGTAVVARGPYLIYAMYDPVNDTTWVCWGREADAGELVGRLPGETVGVAAIKGAELGPYVWNVAPIVLHGFRVSALHVSGLATDGPRLWIFGQGPKASPGVSSFWAPLAYTTPYADLKAGRGRRFAQSCFTVLPSEDGGEDAILKDVEEVQQEAENMGGGNTIRISAAREGESTFTQLASFSSGPRVLSQVNTAFVSQRPTFRIDMSGSPLSPPIARRTTIRWLANPDVRQVRKYTLLLGRNQRNASGGLSGRDAEQQVARLVALASASARVTLTDEVGNTLMVRILTVQGPAEVEAVAADGRVLVCSVTLSVFKQAGAPFGYDAGVSWDSGRSWS